MAVGAGLQKEHVVGTSMWETFALQMRPTKVCVFLSSDMAVAASSMLPCLDDRPVHEISWVLSVGTPLCWNDVTSIYPSIDLSVCLSIYLLGRGEEVILVSLFHPVYARPLIFSQDVYLSSHIRR
jgi:hypothetical protein